MLSPAELLSLRALGLLATTLRWGGGEGDDDVGCSSGTYLVFPRGSAGDSGRGFAVFLAVFFTSGVLKAFLIAPAAASLVLLCLMSAVIAALAALTLLDGGAWPAIGDRMWERRTQSSSAFASSSSPSSSSGLISSS